MAEVEKTNQKRRLKKRTRNPSEWIREKRKRLRVAGKSYVNSRGDVVNERKIGADCKCRRKCYSKVPEDQRNKLFDGYYSLNSHDEQNAYLFGLIRKHDIARKKSKESDRRTCSYKYYVRIRGKEIQICRLAFANIHGISPHKIRILCQKQDQNVMFPRDGRGKHTNRPRKISEDTLQKIKQHIFSIVSSDRIYDFLREEKHIGPNVNITKMWKDYLEKYDPNYKDLFVEGEAEILHAPKESDSLLSTSCNLMEISESELVDDPQPHHFSTMDLTEYPISAVGDTLDLLDNGNEPHFNETSVEDEPKMQSTKPRRIPIVKHWLYSKVFHEEFKINDFLALKKKLCNLKDISKVPPNSQASKSERKQRTPKKISREKDMCPALSVKEPVSVLNPIPSLNFALDVTPSEVESCSAGQSGDMYILPVNLQDLAPLPHSQVPSQPVHALQFNVHSLAAQSGMLSPVVSVAAAPGVQCSGVVTLPPSTVSLTQSSCGYVNLNMAAFY